MIELAHRRTLEELLQKDWDHYEKGVYKTKLKNETYLFQAQILHFLQMFHCVNFSFNQLQLRSVAVCFIYGTEARKSQVGAVTTAAVLVT